MDCEALTRLTICSENWCCVKTKRPDCCEEGKTHIESDYDLTRWEIALFSMPTEEYSEMANPFDLPMPIPLFVEAKYCPFCGDKLPHPRVGLFKKPNWELT